MPIEAVDALKLPKGTTAERPYAATVEHTGYVRYNTQTQQFEGFGAGNNWGSLGGVMDVDGDTFVKAENTAGNDNDELWFVTNASRRMTIKDDGNIVVNTPNSAFYISGDMNITKEFGSSNHDTILKLKLPAVEGIHVENTTGIGLYRSAYGMSITGGLKQNVGAYGAFSTISNGVPSERMRISHNLITLNGTTSIGNSNTSYGFLLNLGRWGTVASYRSGYLANENDGESAEYHNVIKSRDK